ncbi:MAG TPA: HlyD family efflux transporter periplasmic adaptor subunit [Kofleriaceae bacterium]|jgi:multidrug resistance efflux pump|nr:HlyD family efflux transporter periplasmic adaptor subunit [Kofleriaceae bacterium]
MTVRWLLVVAGCAACRGEPVRPVAGEPARAVTLARGTIADRQLMTGELHAVSSVALTTPRTESWQLAIRWLAEDGAQVKAGDRVVELDNSAFTAQLEEKRLGLLEAEMTLRGAQDLDAIETAQKVTELRQHQIALDKATVHAGVPADLLTGREAQERQLDQKRAEVAVDKAAHDLAAQREQAALDLRIKQIALDKARRAIEAAEKTIADLVLTAPRDGIVVVAVHDWLGRKVQAGDTVISGMPIASLPDLTQGMEVHAELSDVDDGRVAVGMAGVCTLDAYPRDAMPCTVKDVTPVARSKGESSLRRSFAVVLGLDRAGDPARMRPGMSVKVEIHPQTVPNVVVVPRGAIEIAPAVPGGPGAPPPSSDRRPAKVRMTGGELRDVTLGACDAQGCAALDGVAVGDVVQVGGPS